MKLYEGASHCGHSLTVAGPNAIVVKHEAQATCLQASVQKLSWCDGPPSTTKQMLHIKKEDDIDVEEVALVLELVVLLAELIF